MAESINLTSTQNDTLCLYCHYDISEFKIGDNCPKCSSTIQLLVSQSALSNRMAVISFVFGAMSIGAVVTSIAFYPFKMILPLQLVGICCGFIAIIYARKARRAVRIGQAPIRGLKLGKWGRFFGWIGLVFNLILTVMLILLVILFVWLANWAIQWHLELFGIEPVR